MIILSNLEKMIEEIEKGPNRAVAIIREFNREWNKKAKNDNSLIKDGFIIIMKEDLMESDMDNSYKEAFKYL